MPVSSAGGTLFMDMPLVPRFPLHTSARRRFAPPPTVVPAPARLVPAAHSACPPCPLSGAAPPEEEIPGIHWKGGGVTPCVTLRLVGNPPPSPQVPRLCPATVSLTPNASFNGICNRQ